MDVDKESSNLSTHYGCLGGLSGSVIVVIAGCVLTCHLINERIGLSGSQRQT